MISSIFSRRNSLDGVAAGHRIFRGTHVLPQQLVTQTLPDPQSVSDAHWEGEHPPAWATSTQLPAPVPTWKLLALYFDAKEGQNQISNRGY